MSHSEADGMSSELPPLPEGMEFNIPDTPGEFLDKLDSERLAHEKLEVGERWLKLTDRLTDIDSHFGSSDESQMSFHSDGGRLGRRVLISTMYVKRWRFRGGSSEAEPDSMIPAWSIIVTDHQETETTETVNYREYTLAKEKLGIAKAEATVTKPLEEDWTFQNIKGCVLFGTSEGVCYVNRGMENDQVMLPKSNKVPESLDEVRALASDISEVNDAIRNLGIGTHEDEISAMKISRSKQR